MFYFQLNANDTIEFRRFTVRVMGLIAKFLFVGISVDFKFELTVRFNFYLF